MKEDTIADCVQNVAIRGQRLRNLIKSVHCITHRKYKGHPLWALVMDITSFGSNSAADLCVRLNLDPHQDAGGKELKNHTAKLTPILSHIDW
jgi:hypothetical protein